MVKSVNFQIHRNLSTYQVIRKHVAIAVATVSEHF